MNELNHGPGKGDKDRSPGWRKNYSKVKWPVVAPEGFITIRPGRQRKTYGKQATRIVLMDLAKPDTDHTVYGPPTA